MIRFIIATLLALSFTTFVNADDKKENATFNDSRANNHSCSIEPEKLHDIARSEADLGIIQISFRSFRHFPALGRDKEIRNEE